MTYGLLIGLCFAALWVYFANPSRKYENNDVLLLKSLVRIGCILVFAPSLGAFIGLLIQGA